MITYILLQVLISLVGTILFFLPNVTTLPFGMDDVLASGVGGVKAFIAVCPPLGILISAGLAYMSFRLVLLGVKVVLGHRAPVHN